MVIFQPRTPLPLSLMFFFDKILNKFSNLKIILTIKVYYIYININNLLSHVFDFYRLLAAASSCNHYQVEHEHV